MKFKLFKQERTKATNLVGLEITKRKYKRPAFIVSLSLIALGFAFFYLPIINPVTMAFVAMKVLWRFG